MNRLNNEEGDTYITVALVTLLCIEPGSEDHIIFDGRALILIFVIFMCELLPNLLDFFVDTYAALVTSLNLFLFLGVVDIFLAHLETLSVRVPKVVSGEHSEMVGIVEVEILYQLGLECLQWWLIRHRLNV